MVGILQGCGPPAWPGPPLLLDIVLVDWKPAAVHDHHRHSSAAIAPAPPWKKRRR